MTTVTATQETTPNKLLDAVIGKLGLKNDSALSRVLEVGPPVISKIRRHTLPVGPMLMIRIHDATGMAINEIRACLGVEPVLRHGTGAAV